MVKKSKKYGLWRLDAEKIEARIAARKDHSVELCEAEYLLSGNLKEENIPPEYAPEKLMTADQCLEAVKQDGKSFEYVLHIMRRHRY